MFDAKHPPNQIIKQEKAAINIDCYKKLDSHCNKDLQSLLIFKQHTTELTGTEGCLI